ncbi:hypothetical protein E2C01_051595 [Portunus trituberculatus]|uniref:Uncharacterized protein n=1 Tax=Portunus trituberculatus TaxID=210409 RepID=A0A5B7GBF3_PORTR|nr:hypothetical protein [Portunus trituberculatus]
MTAGYSGGMRCIPHRRPSQQHSPFLSQHYPLPWLLSPLPRLVSFRQGCSTPGASLRRSEWPSQPFVGPPRILKN